MRATFALLVLALAACANAPTPSAEIKRAAAIPEPRALVALTPEALLERIAKSDKRCVLVNVWATWCEPCKEELPDFLALARRNPDVELILVSADFESQRGEAEAFLATLGVSFETYLRKGGDAELIDALSRDWSGALPATILYGADRSSGKLMEGRVAAEDLEREVAIVLGRSP